MTTPTPPGPPGDTGDHRVVVTAGHVDHGKSTLVAALTDMDPDRLVEERRRGMTIELGFVWTTLPATPRTPHAARVAFVDVPGHERLVATMLAGAGAAPAALLVVAADDGWSAQSSEHRDVLDLLGVPAVLRVVTKADTVDDPGRVDEVVAELEAATAGTSLDDAPIVVTDAVSGRGMPQLRDALRDAIDRLPTATDLGRPRLWADRAFDLTGVGTVVTGTLTDGRFALGDHIEVLPGGRRARVRRLHCLGEQVTSVGPGTRVAINLAGIDHDEVARGDAVVGGGPWRTTTAVDAWVRVVADSRIDRTGAWRLHVGATSVGVRVLPIEEAIAGPGSGAVRLLLEGPLPLVAGDRLVLREVGRRRTVAGGTVVDAAPPVRPRGATARRDRAAALRSARDADSGAERLRASVDLAGGSREVDVALATAGWAPTAPLPDDLVRVGDHLVATGTLTRWTEEVRALGEGVHDRRQIATAARSAGAPEGAAAGLAEALVADGTLVRTEHGVALPEHVDAAASARRDRTAAVLDALLADPFAPPGLDEVTRAHGLDARERAALISSGHVVRCGRVAFAAEAIARAAEQLRTLQAASGPFTASEARQALGTTRRFLIPLLEHLERTGVTRFDGERHRLR